MKIKLLFVMIFVMAAISIFLWKKESKIYFPGNWDADYENWKANWEELRRM